MSQIGTTTSLSLEGRKSQFRWRNLFWTYLLTIVIGVAWGCEEGGTTLPALVPEDPCPCEEAKRSCRRCGVIGGSDCSFCDRYSEACGFGGSTSLDGGTADAQCDYAAGGGTGD